MRRCSPAKAACIAALLSLSAHPAGSGAQPVSEEEVTAEGLHRVDPSVVEYAWLRPGVDLSLYTHAFILPTVVLFRDLPPPSHSAWSDATRDTFPVEDAMRQRLQKVFGESFHEIMATSPDFEISDRLGRHVVLVRAYVTDVATGLPPARPGSNVGTVRWLWEGNLILELRDSMSDEMLLRIANRQRVDGPVEAERIWSLAPRVTRQWSRFMVDQLSKVSDLYPSHLRRMYESAREAAN